ncbi:MAG: YbaB/EbfC family nucleoid-associated protein [Pirellulaceae bacterium]|nr:YbaB/EbfC family nucleoid-associated protein [Pirellulaceae bacterium]
MFNFKNLSGLSQLMMNAGSITERVQQMRQNLSEEVATGSAAEGAIHIEVTGAGEVRKLLIHASLIEHGATDQLEQLLPQAINEALAKVRQMHISKVRELTGGIDLPGLDDLLKS